MEVTRALFHAIAVLKGTTVNQNQGKPWNDLEDTELQLHFGRGLPVNEIAHMHGRTSGAIRSRLVKLGLVERDKGK